MMIIDILKMKNFCEKFIDEGIEIRVDFDRQNIVILGTYWPMRNALISERPEYMTKRYSYETIEHLPDNFPFEELISQFVNMFKEKIKSRDEAFKEYVEKVKEDSNECN